MILTKTKGLAMVYYITNYATKLDTPMWKRIALATEVARQLREAGGARCRAPGPTLPDDRQQAVLNKSRQFLMRTANRIFSERQLSAVEVCYHLLGYDTDFTNVPHWSFLNLTALYWTIFRLWAHLRHQAGELTDAEQPPETIPLRQGGRTLLCLDAIPTVTAGCKSFDGPTSTPSRSSGYISDDHDDDHPVYIKRNSVLHLALFVPWENFISESQGDITDIWTTHRARLCPRLRFYVSNICLLRKSAEDAPRYGDMESAAALPGSDLDEQGPRMLVDVSPVTSFVEMGRTTAASFTLNYLQTMALQLVCVFLDKYTADPDSAGQHLQYTGGPGGTGKSRIIDALKGVFAARDQPHLLQITGTSGSSAAQIGGTTIHSACGLDSHRDPNKPPPPFSEAKKWIWKLKLVLVIDEVNRRTEHRPLRQATISHHSGWLWYMFKTVVLLEDQVRARNDPQLRALLDRVRNGRQTQQDLSLLNANIVGRSQITFHDGLRAITPLNRTRWALNMEAVVGWARFNRQHIRIFVSTHTWRNGTLSPNIGMPVVVNKNIYTGLKVDTTWRMT
ncbi:RmlC-like jelly roll fold protein [Hirsutella rhossiliensis]|uniref:RmlC-like jelly roll fold protein n=1 Tax=Hirsutella rhossiliensis TaxID=111463 RepID=A0A9P8MU84_9HYPO|nr:RmlC-like jelly roll fold protein [Hirsutella rhossiliensis]KAH0961162.1 RmlC-like jelly roll fold protein [Hirsutella rhossiliensis]